MSQRPMRHFCAFAPFPRSAWTHPNAPPDGLDRVCRVIWSRAAELRARVESSQRKRVTIPSDNEPAERAEEGQEEVDDSDLRKQNEAQAVGCGPHVAKPASVMSPSHNPEIKLNNDKSERRRKLEEDAEDEAKIVDSSVKTMWTFQTKRKKQKNKTQTSHSQSKFKRREDVCESEDKLKTKGVSDGNTSNDDDFATLPGVQTCATDSSVFDLVSDINEVKDIETPRHTDCSNSECEEAPPSITETDFPHLPINKTGVPLSPTKPSAVWKEDNQWKTPLSFHPHNSPTSTLASGTSSPVLARLQGKALQSNSKTDTFPVQQRAYDLLTDFPTLQPPENPLALGKPRHGNFKSKAMKAKGGRTLSPNHCQDGVVSHEKRLENVPREVSSICSGAQKSVQKLKAFGLVSQPSSPTVSCERGEANNPLPPTVSGADGAGVNARSWASAAKEGMRRAAAPQEKARPCAFQHIVTINKGKGQRCPISTQPCVKTANGTQINEA